MQAPSLQANRAGKRVQAPSLQANRLYSGVTAHRILLAGAFCYRGDATSKLCVLINRSIHAPGQYNISRRLEGWCRDAGTISGTCPDNTILFAHVAANLPVQSPLIACGNYH